MKGPCCLFFCSQYNKWTLPYEDHLNMGRVLTVSRPFFDDYILASPSKSGHHKHVTRVAGIAGADVLYRDVEKALDVKNVSDASMLLFFVVSQAL